MEQVYIRSLANAFDLRDGAVEEIISLYEVMIGEDRDIESAISTRTGVSRDIVEKIVDSYNAMMECGI